MRPCDLRELGSDIHSLDCLTRRDGPITSDFSRAVTFAFYSSGAAAASVYELGFLGNGRHHRIAVKEFII